MFKVLSDQKIKLLYISPRDVLKARSDPIHIMASCKWFCRAGVEVELLAPYYFRPENILEQDLFKTYGIDENDRFLVTHLPTKLTDNSSMNSVRLKKIVCFTWDALKRFLFKREYKKYSKYIVYSKCYLSFLPLYYLKKLFCLKNVLFVFEAASFQNKREEIKTLHKFSYIVAINLLLKKDIADFAGFSNGKIVVPAHGLDNSFNEDKFTSKAEVRKKIGLNESEFIALYSGKISRGENSEVALIMHAAQKMPDVRFIFTGGKPVAIEYFLKLSQKLGINNISFTGFFASQNETFPFLRAANVLISFYPKSVPTLKYMVPNKIIQYARSRTVMVSAYYPAIEAMIGKDGAFFVEPENIEALAEAINKVKNKDVNGDLIAANAYKKIIRNSYKKRTSDILTLILQ